MTGTATATAYPTDACLHELFEAHAELRPEAVAVVSEGIKLTYRELDDRANRLAHHLRSLGVGPEVRVGICVRRSAEMVVAVFGVLKAGGAYVPLDPSYPADRIALMLEDSGARVVVAHDRFAQFVARPGCHVVRFDADRAMLERQPTSRIASGVLSTNLAYVIYTSGTTGRPKGVMVEHRSVVNLVTAVAALENITPDDRSLQFSSLSFDASVEELFTALTHGATIVVRGDDVPSAAELLGPTFEGVTIMNLSTGYWHALDPELLPPSVLLVVVGGERALPAHVRAWCMAATTSRLLNFYGPTETTVDATGGLLAVDGLLPGREVPIGGPLANYRVHVLDRHGQHVPVGVPGELFIGGDGVARGYLGRPDLTSERFVPDRFAGVAGARLYRTGDRVRRFPNGTLEYLGRIDHQVKVRGFRIELGEIEAVLSRHASVREVVVVARDDEPGEMRLVAYVVGRDAAVAIEGLRTYVSTTLPAYMVPTAFVVLDALPLLPNGKLDRKALPAPDLTSSQRAYLAPRTEVETLLAQVWSELLGVERVG
ncbi:MAG: amino acid adenylation domain-containing protein, partial [Kofleriaceae bacterium]|nr:amino acid adenylation domain-containing protein [Kofleriaceae bacterium]